MHSALIAVVLLSAARAATIHDDAGPSYPFNHWTAADCFMRDERFVDANNMCWFWWCVINEDTGEFSLLPKRCALGTTINYHFTGGVSNPCTEYGYECTRQRESIESIPPCMSEIKCYNGGTAVFQAGRCWCLCPPNWLGEEDCSKVTAPDREEPESTVCIGGKPKEDWCGKAGGCLNGGSCYNQCDDYWCDCPDHYTFNYKGKRCEI